MPSNVEEKSNWRDIGLRRATGKIEKTVKKGIDDKAQVDMRFTGTLDYSPEKLKKHFFNI